MNLALLEAKIEAHKTKIADLEAQKEKVSILNETAEDKPEIKNVIGKIKDAPNLPSTEQPKDVQRAQTILSLASNLKEFFLPALTSDSK